MEVKESLEAEILVERIWKALVMEKKKRWNAKLLCRLSCGMVVPLHIHG